MISLKRQILAMFLGLMFLVVGLVFLINAGLMEPYYIDYKQNEMLRLYETLNQAVANGAIRGEESQGELFLQSERANISATVVTQDGEILFYTEQEKRGPLYEQLFGYVAELNKGEWLESQENYSVFKVESALTGREYLEMFGTLFGGAKFIMRTPLESIHDAAILTNRFLIYVAVPVVLVGALFVVFFTRKITGPVMELAELSKRMANLDFNAKYTGGVRNEIGVLGENFNMMSRKLEMTISELKSANNQLLQDIEQKEKIENMRGEFLGNVSHELKTPIALIQGYAEGLRESVNDDAQSREFYCEVIIDEAAKMNQMVKNLLTLNQLEFGAEEPVMERFDIVDLIKGVLASCEILISQADTEIDFIADEQVYVWADELKTEQVFRNYLVNALHHVANERRIQIQAARRGACVHVSVFNSGNPIAEEDVEKIWQKFYKADKAHTREYGGNGIGLSIVKAVMESMHQKYGVKNFDNGVEFWFELDAG